MYEPWDLQQLWQTGQEQKAHWIQEALDRTKFNFKSLIPGLVAQVRRDYIPVEIVDLSNYVARTHGEGHDYHAIAREIEGRKRVLGLAWYSGKVSLDSSLPKDLLQEVFLAEGAHMVDFFFLTPAQREAIFEVYHRAPHGVETSGAHDHGWFEENGNTNYWHMVGESFMYGFTMAYSDIPTTGEASFTHRTTSEVAELIRNIITPQANFVRRINSSIVHRVGSWHDRQTQDAFQEFYVEDVTKVDGTLRRCKTCRWEGV